MKNYEILGIREGQYTDKKTKEKNSFRTLFLGFEDEGINGIGCKDVFFPLARFPAVATLRLGDHVHVFYNESGYVEEVIKVG